MHMAISKLPDLMQKERSEHKGTDWSYDRAWCQQVTPLLIECVWRVTMGSVRGDYQMTSTSHATYEAVTQQVSLKKQLVQSIYLYCCWCFPLFEVEDWIIHLSWMKVWGRQAPLAVWVEWTLLPGIHHQTCVRRGEAERWCQVPYWTAVELNDAYTLLLSISTSGQLACCLCNKVKILMSSL